MVGTLEGAIFWEKKSDKYQPHCLPAEQGTSCMDIQVDPFTKNYLLSYRPSEHFGFMMHCFANILIVIQSNSINPTHVHLTYVITRMKN